MDEEILEGINIIENYWGTEEKFCKFGEKWIQGINKKYFSRTLPEVKLQIIPMSIFSIMSSSNADARCENHFPPHIISVGVVLLKENHEKILAILLHELTHVWERVYSPETTGVQTNIENSEIPDIIKEAIKKTEKKSTGDSFHGHSSVFIKKLHDICKMSGTSLVLSGRIDKEINK